MNILFYELTKVNKKYVMQFSVSSVLSKYDISLYVSKILNSAVGGFESQP